MEHPDDPGRDPFPSIWITRDVLGWERSVSAFRTTFSRCNWGCPARKLTTISGTVEGVKEFDIPCTHARHAPIYGKGVDGRFRTRVVQSYPSKMCKKLAEDHVERILQQPPRDRPQQVSAPTMAKALRRAAADRLSNTQRSAGGLPERYLQTMG